MTLTASKCLTKQQEKWDSFLALLPCVTNGLRNILDSVIVLEWYRQKNKEKNDSLFCNIKVARSSYFIVTKPEYVVGGRRSGGRAVISQSKAFWFDCKCV